MRGIGVAHMHMLLLISARLVEHSSARSLPPWRLETGHPPYKLRKIRFMLPGKAAQQSALRREHGTLTSSCHTQEQPWAVLAR